MYIREWQKMDIQVRKAAVACSEFPPVRHKKAWVSREYHRKNAHGGSAFIHTPPERADLRARKTISKIPCDVSQELRQLWAKRGKELVAPPTPKAGFLWRSTCLRTHPGGLSFSGASWKSHLLNVCLPEALITSLRLARETRGTKKQQQQKWHRG